MPKMKACPVCGQNVSLDKLEMHVRKVHPREKVDIQLDEEEKKEVVEAKKAYKPSTSSRGKWVILVAAIMVVVVVLALVLWPSTGLSVGSNPPDYTLPDTYQTPWNLESHKRDGKPILIEFMHPDCPACKAATPVLVALFQNYSSEVEFVTIAITLEVEDFRNPPTYQMAIDFMMQHGTDWTYLVETSGTQVRDLYKVTSTPTFYLVNKNGRLGDMNPDPSITEAAQIGTRDYATMRAAILQNL